MKYQKKISDYISRHRNSRNWFRRLSRTLCQKYLYIKPENRLKHIYALAETGQMDRYYPALRDVAIEFARYGHTGEALKLAPLIPPEYRTSHFENVLKIVENPEGRNFSCVSIEISTICNLRCPICVHGGRKTPVGQINKIMNLKDFQRIWAEIGPRTQAVSLGGRGESFTHPNIYDLIDLVRPTAVALDTNGNLDLDVHRLVGSNLSSINFSIDGHDQRTFEKYRVGGSFTKAIDNLTRLLKARQEAKAHTPRINWKYLLFKHNEMYVDQARQIAASLGVDDFIVHPGSVFPYLENYEQVIRDFVPLGPAALPFIKYFDLDRQILVLEPSANPAGCPIVSYNPCILVDGSVLPCWGCSGQPFYPDLNIFKSDFDAIWNNDRYRTFRRTALKDKDSLPYCQGCYVPAAFIGGLYRQLQGTPLAYPEPIQPDSSRRLLAYADLRINAAYAEDLKAQGRQNELKYFQESGRL